MAAIFRHTTSKPLFIAAVLLGALLVPDVGTAQENTQPTKRPNIVLIMADDMGFSDIGCYGGEVDTPNLDRLAAQGMRFTQFYNNAKCDTTRVSLLTGLYPRRQGKLLKRNMVTLGEALGAAGYQTSLSGKWHLGRDQQTHPFYRGFDRYYGLLDGCCNFFNPVQRDPPFKGGRIRVFGHDDQFIKSFPDDYYTTDAFTDHAIESIQQFAKSERPFFLHVCYTAPHYPLHAKPEDIAKYKGRYMIDWEELRKQRFARQQEMGLADDSWHLSDTDFRSYDWAAANQEWEDLRMATYAAMIDCMDQNIGRLLDTLAATGELENTVIMFLSDNGGCAEEPGGRNDQAIPGIKEFYTAVGPAWGWAQNSPFRRYKAWTHEGGITTPFIVSWPGKVEAGSITRQPGHLIDMMPTVLEIAGGTYPDEFAGNEILPVEGKSLLPVFAGKQREPHASLCWEWAGSRAVRAGNWKLVFDKHAKAWELFDLSVDRTEMKDLAKEKPELVSELQNIWQEWAQRTGLN